MKGVIKGVGLVLAVLFMSSCVTRTYVQDKGRVDQEMMGNGGCIQGTCPQVDRSKFQKTRKTYVLEVTTGPKTIKAAPSSESMSMDSSEEYVTPARTTNFAKTRSLSTETVIAQEAAVEPTFAEYKIEEGDTLQKISKKFYNTVRRWNDIYEANRDVLSSPDRIKPGKVIRIPQN